MPIIRVSKRDLKSLLGGVALDVDTIHRYFAKLKCEVESVEGDIVEYEANSDRPDLFSAEGLSRALKPWLGLEWRGYEIRRSNVRGYATSIPERPYVALAVVRDLSLSSEAISQIMQLQEKLAQTYGRARRKVSIGVYDLGDLDPPIYYDLANPDTVRFRPLELSEEITLREVVEKTEKGILYGYIVKHMEKYPVLRDSKGSILSLVPIVNSEDCKVKTTTKDVLIDATGTSLEDVVNAVTIMATSIAERSKSGVIESVEVVYENGLVVEAPRKAMPQLSVNISEVNDLLGTNLDVREVVELLKKFYYEVVRVVDHEVIVRPPIYRIDVKSWVDVAEDIAIAYGYDKLGAEADSLPPSKAPGRVHPIEYVSRRLRDVLLGLGFQEVANYMMSSRLTQLGLLGIEQEMFLVDNPRSERFEGLRIWLTPQLLEVIRDNSEKSSRLMIFELGDVVLPDENSETGARVERRLGMAITHEKATLTDGLACVKALLEELGALPVFAKKTIRGFLPERTAAILACNSEIGFVGEIDPRVLHGLRLNNPVVVAEIYLDKIIKFCT